MAPLIESCNFVNQKLADHARTHTNHVWRQARCLKIHKFIQTCSGPQSTIVVFRCPNRAPSGVEVFHTDLSSGVQACQGPDMAPITHFGLLRQLQIIFKWVLLLITCIYWFETVLLFLITHKKVIAFVCCPGICIQILISYCDVSVTQHYYLPSESFPHP